MAPKSIYEQLLQAEKPSTAQDIVDKENSKRIRVHMPCKVINVNGTTVDVEIQGQEDSGFGYYVNFPQLLDLPILYNSYTSVAYIITPVQVGDTGLVEFLDFNSSNFTTDGSTSISSDQYPHNINNGIFINGYIPTSKQIDIPVDKPIVIGLKNKTFTMSVDMSGSLIINSNSEIKLTSSLGITVDSPKVDFSGNINVGNGASGAFTTGDGSTVNVSNGIITDIES